MNEMSPPSTALSDPKAKEILRAWVAHNQLHIAFHPKTWDDPFAWGLFIVDLMHHVARGYEGEGVMRAEQALASVKAGFDAEWENRTDPGTTFPDRTN